MKIKNLIIIVFGFTLLLHSSSAISQNKLSEEQLNKIKKQYDILYKSLIDSTSVLGKYTDKNIYYEKLFQSVYQNKTYGRSEKIESLEELGYKLYLPYKKKFILNIKIDKEHDIIVVDTTELNFSILIYDKKNRYKDIIGTGNGEYILGCGTIYGSKHLYKQYKSMFQKALKSDPDYILNNSTHPCVVSYVKDDKIYHLCIKPSSNIYRWFEKKWERIYFKLFF